MGAPLTYNYAGITGAAGQVRAGTGQVQVHIEGVQSVMSRLAALWGGTGSQQYIALQTRLTQQFNDYVAASNDLATRLDSAGAGMMNTDNGVGNMFFGGV